MDHAAIDEVAKIFVRARQTGERLDPLPSRLAPRNFTESCAVMDAVDRLVGDDIVGTKIAAKPGAEVVYAPLHGGRVFMSPAQIPVCLTPCQYMECEISFRLSRDLPARQLHRHRLIHRLPPGANQPDRHRRVRWLRHDGSYDRRVSLNVATRARHTLSVMPGLDPSIHEGFRRPKPYGCVRGISSWIAGSSPAMTPRGWRSVGQIP